MFSIKDQLLNLINVLLESFSVTSKVIACFSMDVCWTNWWTTIYTFSTGILD